MKCLKLFNKKLFNKKLFNKKLFNKKLFNKKLFNNLVTLSFASSFLVSCGGDNNSELYCSYFLFVNESSDYPLAIKTYAPGDEDGQQVWINAGAYYYFGGVSCEADEYPTPEDVFENVEAFTENSEGHTLIYSGVKNIDWSFDAYSFSDESGRRYSIGFDDEGLAPITRQIQ